jgi:trk system potassium uptake protein TrkH
MNFRSVLHIISYLLIVIGVAMVVCGVVAWIEGDPLSTRRALLITGGVTGAAFSLLAYSTTGAPRLTRGDGFAIVTLGWISASIIGAVPYVWAGIITHPVAAVFETMSGYTTTGASVLTDLESIPRGIMLWRALTHFFGGMGVLVLCVAILPFLGAGGMQIFRAEVPGPDKDRLTPRIAVTAKLLWGVYILFCVVEAVLLRFGGMDWFEAWCQTFATMATGGFSTRTASIGGFDSVYIEMVITVFMFLAGVNFALHYQALTGRLAVFWKNTEFRFYLCAWLGACLLLTLNTRLHVYDSVGAAVRNAFFTGTSIMTTTGFVTADYETWPVFSQVLIVLLMFLGGCAGSTGGGIKAIRIWILLKAALREVRQFLSPNAVVRVKVGKKAVDPAMISHIAGFAIIYIMFFVLVALIMCFFAPDMATAITASAATIGNIGPGLGEVGPMVNYSEIPAAGQAVLIFSMLLGRLELYTVIVLFLPRFWKRI